MFTDHHIREQMTLNYLIKKFTDFLNIISTSGQSFICGDFNINLLKIFTKPNYNTFFKSMLAHGFSLKSHCQLEYVILVVYL